MCLSSFSTITESLEMTESVWRRSWALQTQVILHKHMHRLSIDLHLFKLCSYLNCARRASHYCLSFNHSHSNSHTNGSGCCLGATRTIWHIERKSWDRPSNSEISGWPALIRVRCCRPWFVYFAFIILCFCLFPSSQKSSQLCIHNLFSHEAFLNFDISMYS